MSSYQRVQEILDNAIGGPAVTIGRHKAFWRDRTRDEFVAHVVFGKPVVTVGEGAASNLVLALKGQPPFGRGLPGAPPEATIKRMPSSMDPVPDEQIAEIEQWIDDGCPDQPAQTQLRWRPTNAPTADSRTDDIWFTSPDRGWAVNSSGQILHTEDGGVVWQQQFHDPEVYFRCIGFASDDRGWVGTLTFGKRLLETSDGGGTWTFADDDLPPLAPEYVCGMSVVSPTVVYASGTNDPEFPARMMRTVDGGARWTAWDMSEHADLLVDTYFTDADHGWVVGGKAEAATDDRDDVRAVVLRTEDGGATWTNRAADLAHQLPLGEWGWKIQFLDDQVGFVALESFTRGAILKTTDGGEHWTRIEIDDPQGNANLEGIGFVDEHTGWVGGWGPGGFVNGFSSATSDGGDTWQDANDIGLFINRFRFFGDPVTVGYASGLTVYKYSDKPMPVPIAGAEGTQLFADNAPTSSGVPVEVAITVPEGSERLTVGIWGRFGTHVRRLVDEPTPAAGPRSVSWDLTDDSGAELREGSYIIRVTVDDHSESRLVRVSA